MLYPLCPDLLAPHGTTSHQGLQGFSIHSAKTVSSLPLASIHIPAVKRHTLPTTATQRLDHASTPVNRSFALTAVSWPTSYSCLAPQTVESCWKNRQNGKSDNAVTQQIFRGAFFFCILCNMSGKTQRMHTCGTRLTAQWFLTGGVFKTTVALAHNPLAAVLSICLCLLFAFQTWQLFLAPARSNEGETQTMCGN